MFEDELGLVFLFSSLSPNSTYLNVPVALDVPLNHCRSHDSHVEITTLMSVILKIMKTFQSTFFLSDYASNFIISNLQYVRTSQRGYRLKCSISWSVDDIHFIENTAVSLRLPQEAVRCLAVIAVARLFYFFCPADSWCHLLQHHLPHSRFMCMSRGENFKAI